MTTATNPEYQKLLEQAQLLHEKFSDSEFLNVIKEQEWYRELLGLFRASFEYGEAYALLHERMKSMNALDAIQAENVQLKAKVMEFEKQCRELVQKLDAAIAKSLRSAEAQQPKRG